MSGFRKSALSLPILCFDLDGTLLDGHGRIHPRDAAILSGETAALLVPTTGRPLHAVRRAFARHGLFTDRPLPFPLVLQNGSLLYLPGEQLLEYTPFAREDQEALLELAQHHPQITFMLLDQTSIHVLWPRTFAERAAASYDFITQPFTPGSRHNAFSKLMAVSENPSELATLRTGLSGIRVETAYSMPTILEVTPLGVDKSKGLRSLLAALGLGSSPIYAAGDGGNDLPLFELAERSFAPLHSPQAVRAAAGQLLDVPAGGVLAPMLQAAGLSG